ncbi:hypothetical protein T01_1157 [Trichinella spiralis]|uniref:Uncharacterized protein n=1 Tax=Trichinella spiralis TaxID=6334 RepID=A0A0V1BND3_TRISP|nr:hypothetical protein T01_1157 [Trichinella spiralis]
MGQTRKSMANQSISWLASQTDRQPRPWLKRKVIASSSSSNREAEKTQSCHRRQLQTAAAAAQEELGQERITSVPTANSDWPTEQPAVSQLTRRDGIDVVESRRATMIVFGLIFLSKSCTFADRPTDRPTATTTTATTTTTTTTTITAAITTIITIIIFIIGDVDFFLQPTSAFCEENLPKTNEPQEREKKNM